MNLSDLKKPFAPDRISWRVGSVMKDGSKGMALAYIDARDVMGRLDEVCGPYWQCEYIPMPNGTCCCRVGVKVGEEWIWRSNGAINLTDSDKTDQKEMTEKGSYSDAFKRASVLFGIGQYLYDLDSPWVMLDEKKRIIPSEFKRLEALLAGAKPKAETREEKGNKLDVARAWAKSAMHTIQGLDESEREAWMNAPENAERLVKLRAIDPDTHIQIIKALQG